ncbi:MAG: hypothetical protein DDT30_01995 [Dehalococcoidia bacterium]|nr:hypothetical protein [Bacillota bacterium]MBT9142868.1 hypothetical protein [Bacillota bacterium]
MKSYQELMTESADKKDAPHAKKPERLFLLCLMQEFSSPG